MPDRILTTEIAQALQDESVREGELLAWMVSGSEGEFVARPVAPGRGALPYVLLADTLDALRGQMPVGLARSGRMPADPEGVIEVWWPPGRSASL